MTQPPPEQVDLWGLFDNLRRAIAADVAEYREERAAIGEYERGLTREESERLADELAVARQVELARRHLPSPGPVAVDNPASPSPFFRATSYRPLWLASLSSASRCAEPCPEVSPPLGSGDPFCSPPGSGEGDQSALDGRQS